MKSETPNAAYFGSLSTQIREDVRTLLKWGHEGARQRCRSTDEQEPAITGYIRQAIQSRLAAPDCPDWCYLYSVHDDPPIEKEGSYGRGRPRADLVIEAHIRGRPEYIFEAKRLRANGYGVNKYIAKDGMGCLISGNYARRYDEAVMLGYVQSDNLEYWTDQIKVAVTSNSARLYLLGGLKSLKVTPDFPLEWTSEHKRVAVGRNVIIHHILLDFR